MLPLSFTSLFPSLYLFSLTFLSLVPFLSSFPFLWLFSFVYSFLLLPSFPFLSSFSFRSSFFMLSVPSSFAWCASKLADTFDDFSGLCTLGKTISDSSQSSFRAFLLDEVAIDLSYWSRVGCLIEGSCWSSDNEGELLLWVGVGSPLKVFFWGVLPCSKVLLCETFLVEPSI